MKTTVHPESGTLKPLLPTGPDPACRDLDEVVRCFKAGS